MATVGVEYVVETSRMYAELQRIPEIQKSVLARMAKDGAALIAEQQRQVIRAASVSAGGLRTTAAAAGEVGTMSRQARAGMASLTQQMIDVGVMLQGGMNPMTILVTQGPQAATAISQAGGAMAAFRAVLASVAPLAGVLGPVAVAVGVLGLAYVELSGDLRDAESAQRAQTEAATAAQSRHEKLRDVLRDVSDAYRLYTGATTETAIKQRDAVEKVAKAFGPEFDSINAKLAENAQKQREIRAELAKGPLTNAEALAGGTEFVDEMTAKLVGLEREAGALGNQLGALASRQAVAASQAFIGAQELDKETRAAKKTKEAIDELALSLKARVDLEEPFRGAMGALTDIRDAQREAILDPEAARRAQAMATSRQIQDAQRSAQALVLTDAQRAEVSSRASQAMAATWRAYYHDIDEMRAEDLEKERQAAEDREREQLQATQQLLSGIGSAFGQVSSSMSQASQNQAAYLGALEADRERMSATMTVAERRHSAERIEAAREEARKGFFLAKAAAAGAAVVNTASAMVAALDDAPWPGNLILSGLAGAAGAVQLGVILGQQPSFARGTTDTGDGFAATMHPREAVATSTGADMLGRANIGRANAGISPGPSVIRVQHVYQHRPFDAFVKDNWDAYGPLRQRVEAGSFPGSRTD